MSAKGEADSEGGAVQPAAVRGGTGGVGVFSIVYAAAGGHVIALDLESGVELWRTKLPTGAFDMGTDTVGVMIARDDALVVSYCGRVYRLDPLSGEIAWTSELSKIPTNKQITLALLDAGSVVGNVVGAVSAAQGSQKAAQG